MKNSPTSVKSCKNCKAEKDIQKGFRKGSRTCLACEYENNKQKRKERWDYLGLDMSKTF